MGFDLCGANPSSEKGKLFINNLWWWRPLWDFVCDNCSDILDEEDIKQGNFNDRHFIERDKAMHISKRLDALLENGAVRKYEQAYMDHIENLPDEICDLCGGKGWSDLPKELLDLSMEADPLSDLKRRREILTAFKRNPGDYQVIRTSCVHCDGKGKTRPLQSAYPFAEENVKNFADFCADSGGFIID